MNDNKLTPFAFEHLLNFDTILPKQSDVKFTKGGFKFNHAFYEVVQVFNLPSFFGVGPWFIIHRVSQGTTHTLHPSYVRFRKITGFDPGKYPDRGEFTYGRDGARVYASRPIIPKKKKSSRKKKGSSGKEDGKDDEDSDSSFSDTEQDNDFYTDQTKEDIKILIKISKDEARRQHRDDNPGRHSYEPSPNPYLDGPRR
jgi:hypothetical protein